MARGHYSVDVVLAYYVTTRVWWVYHTLAAQPALLDSGQHNYLQHLCWWPAARWDPPTVKQILQR